MAKSPEKKIVKKAAKKAIKKQLKKSRLTSGQRMHGSALTGSDYMHTLLDAVNFPGVKIPDAVTTPSFTVQCLTRFLTATTTGTGGNIGVGAYRTLGNTYATAATGYSVLSPSSTAGTYNAAGATNPWLSELNMAQSVRLVSAKMIIKYLGSPNNATGRILAAFLPPGVAVYQGPNGSSGALYAVTLNALAGVPGLVDIPAAKGYAEVRYVPIDPIALTYENFGSIAINVNRPTPLSGAYTATYGAFCFIADGLPTGQSVEVEIWENYECLAFQNLLSFVQPTPSFSDPMELAAVTNLLADAPTLTSTQDPAAVIAGSPFVNPGGMEISPADIRPRTGAKMSMSRRNPAINSFPSAGSMLGDARANMGDIMQDVVGMLPVLGPLVGSLFAGL